MQAPHLIVRDLYRMLVSGRMNGAIAKTLSNTALALVLALGVGIIIGALLHRARALRDTLDPLFATYYAVPVFAFYPFFIVVFGLGSAAGPDRLHARRRRGDRQYAEQARPRTTKCCSRPRGSYRCPRSTPRCG
jgi:hypothetical protein